jgi:hypothetical protein
VSRALVTFATGDWPTLHPLKARPQSRTRGPARLPTGRATLDDAQAPSWMRSPAPRTPSWHQEALWIDCDVVVVDDSRTRRRGACGFLASLVSPSPGRRCPELRRLARPPTDGAGARQLWRMDRYLNHGWWEQAAARPARLPPRTEAVTLGRPTDLYGKTHWLGLEWNSHEQSERHPAPPVSRATPGRSNGGHPLCLIPGAGSRAGA